MKIMKRATAWLLAVLLLVLAKPWGSLEARAESMERLPKLLVSVLYENRTDDGQIDAQVTITLDSGNGSYRPGSIEGLYMKVDCEYGLSCDQKELTWEGYDPFDVASFTLHLIYNDPGYIVDANDPDQKPTLMLHIHTINCGEAEYKCVFDARGQARAIILYQTVTKTGSKMSSPEDIINSANTVGNAFARKKYMYRKVEVRGPIGNSGDWTGEMDWLREQNIDDNDHLHIYCDARKFKQRRK